MDEKRKKAALLLGFGLDGEDGHKRVSRGENFVLVGGSKETHEDMQDKAMGFNDELKKRGRRLEEINHDEFREIAARCGMHVPSQDDRPPR